MSLYETLGVSADARPETIRAAYKRLMQRYHPDKNVGDAIAARKAQQIAQAFQILSDPVLRARYDTQGAAGYPGLIQDLKFRFPRMTRAAKLKAAVFGSCLAVLVTSGVLYTRYQDRQRAAQQQLQRAVALQLKREEERKRQERETQEQFKTAAQAEAQDKARRTISVFEAHRFVALKEPGGVQGLILPPIDVVVGKDSSDRTGRNIASGRAVLRRAVLKELAELRARDLKTSSAESAVTASILKAMNGAVLGGGREAKLCRKDFDEYVCRGIEAVILRGSIEVVPG